jgi:hypothetical protein
MQELWHTIKRLNLKIRDLEEGEEIKEKAWTPYQKIIAENFPILEKERYNQL